MCTFNDTCPKPAYGISGCLLVCGDALKFELFGIEDVGTKKEVASKMTGVLLVIEITKIKFLCCSLRDN
jgi:hypothetical protein